MDAKTKEDAAARARALALEDMMVSCTSVLQQKHKLGEADAYGQNDLGLARAEEVAQDDARHRPVMIPSPQRRSLLRSSAEATNMWNGKYNHESCTTVEDLIYPIRRCCQRRSL